MGERANRPPTTCKKGCSNIPCKIGLMTLVFVCLFIYLCSMFGKKTKMHRNLLKGRGLLLFNADCNEQMFSPKP